VRLNPFRSNKSALILGCGPAGLFAAHALVSRGWEVAIVSNKRKSEMFGAQYLHRPIPGLSSASTGRTVHYLLEGTVEGYREKVYGRRSGVAVSPETLGQSHSAWDIREAYGTAWELYKDLIQPQTVDPLWIASAVGSKQFARVISTIPAPKLCVDSQHSFDSQAVWAIGDAPERGIFCPVTEAQPFQVICNGSQYTGWYRNANIFGYRTAEWGGARKPPLEGIAGIEKPLSTNCDCLPEVIRLGRYGEWRKGVLAHEAYEKALVL
jgi:hypothetical protein